jgi:hypothetical protein
LSSLFTNLGQQLARMFQRLNSLSMRVSSRGIVGRYSKEVNGAFIIPSLLKVQGNFCRGFRLHRGPKTLESFGKQSMKLNPQSGIQMSI